MPDVIDLSTFAGLLRRNHTLGCYCPGCRRWATCDLAASGASVGLHINAKILNDPWRGRPRLWGQEERVPIEAGNPFLCCGALSVTPIASFWVGPLGLAGSMGRGV